MDPNYARVYQHMGFAYESQKMFSEAIAAYRKGVSLAGGTLEVQPDLARALIEDGQRQEGTQILRRLEADAAHRYVSPVDLAGIYTVLGDHEKALRLLETALAQHNGSLLFLNGHSEFNALRSEPRFLHILHEVGGAHP